LQAVEIYGPLVIRADRSGLSAMGFYKTLRRALSNTGFFDQAKKYDEDNELMLVRARRIGCKEAQQQQTQGAPAHMSRCTHCASYNVQKTLLCSPPTTFTILCQAVCMQLAVGIKCTYTWLPRASNPGCPACSDAAAVAAAQAQLHPDAHEEGGLACNDKQLLIEMRE
jgi:hypothetical protein